MTPDELNVLVAKVAAGVKNAELVNGVAAYQNPETLLYSRLPDYARDYSAISPFLDAFGRYEIRNVRGGWLVSIMRDAARDGGGPPLLVEAHQSSESLAACVAVLRAHHVDVVFP